MAFKDLHFFLLHQTTIKLQRHKNKEQEHLARQECHGKAICSPRQQDSSLLCGWPQPYPALQSSLSHAAFHS